MVGGVPLSSSIHLPVDSQSSNPRWRWRSVLSSTAMDGGYQYQDYHCGDHLSVVSLNEIARDRLRATP